MPSSPPFSLTYIFMSSLTFLFNMVMSFCKKSVHTFLNFANSNDVVNGTGTLLESPRRNMHINMQIPSPSGGLSFITSSSDIQRPANVIESAAVKSAAPNSSPFITSITDVPPTITKINSGGIGFVDYLGGSVDGLMSCTESLGFESSDERRADDLIENVNNDELVSKTTPSVQSKWKKIIAKNEVKKFPPPISSLNHDGKPTFFLRPARKDGRLELTEVKIHRPEILRASRQDGRLRLHLIMRDEEEEEEEDVDQEAACIEEKEKEELDVEEKIDYKDEAVLQIEQKAAEWRFPTTSGTGGDGLRRCHELVRQQQHHHNLHGWNLHCVTIW